MAAVRKCLKILQNHSKVCPKYNKWPYCLPGGSNLNLSEDLAKAIVGIPYILIFALRVFLFESLCV